MGQTQTQITEPPRYLVIIHFEEDIDDVEASMSALTISQLYKASSKHMKQDMPLKFQELESKMQLNTDKDLQNVWFSMPQWKKTLHIRAQTDENENIYFNVTYEHYLRQMMIDDIFKLKKSRKGWFLGATDYTKGIKSYYKTENVTECYLCGVMPFRQTRNIFDYFSYLECGYNNDSLWDTQVAGETVKYFDDNHQLMYSKGDAGVILNMFIQPRDLYYMQTRFIVNENGYNIIGSLMYSIDETHPLYYKRENNEYMRGSIKYRGFVLLQPENVEMQGPTSTQLIYMSHFDLHGDIPSFVVNQQLKVKAVQLLQQFDASWNDKVHCLEVRRKDKKKKDKVCGSTLESWLKSVDCLQYYDRFVDCGFGHVYDLRFMTRNYLEQMQVSQEDAVLLMQGIAKLGVVLKRRLVFGFLLNIQISIVGVEGTISQCSYISYAIPNHVLECCLDFIDKR